MDQGAHVIDKQKIIDSGGSSRIMRHAAPCTLSRDVRGYLEYEEYARGTHEQIELPHADGVLVFNLGESITVTDSSGVKTTIAAGQGFVAGPHFSPALSTFDGSQQGIQVELPLETLFSLLRVPMTHFRDRAMLLDDALSAVELRPLGAFMEASTAVDRAAVLNQWLTERLHSRAGVATIDRRLKAAISMLREHREFDINAIADKVGWSRRTLTRHVTNVLGVGPRSYRRLLRFGQLTKHVAIGDCRWSEIAFDCGYADQAHMIREFREFTGTTPARFGLHALPPGTGSD